MKFSLWGCGPVGVFAAVTVLCAAVLLGCADKGKKSVSADQLLFSNAWVDVEEVAGASGVATAKFLAAAEDPAQRSLRRVAALSSSWRLLCAMDTVIPGRTTRRELAEILDTHTRGVDVETGSGTRSIPVSDVYAVLRAKVLDAQDSANVSVKVKVSMSIPPRAQEYPDEATVGAVDCTMIKAAATSINEAAWRYGMASTPPSFSIPVLPRIEIQNTGANKKAAESAPQGKG